MRRSAGLFDYLVGAREQCGRHLDAERLRGLAVDDQLVFGRGLYRQVGWLFAIEDAVNVTGRAPVLIGEIRSEEIRPPAATK
jgi:hypothetical protein